MEATLGDNSKIFNNKMGMRSYEKTEAKGERSLEDSVREVNNGGAAPRFVGQADLRSRWIGLQDIVRVCNLYVCADVSVAGVCKLRVTSLVIAGLFSQVQLMSAPPFPSILVLLSSPQRQI